MAAPRASSEAGSTVRRSSTTRPSSIRPMTGGVPRRRSASRREAEPPAIASPIDGSVSPGSDPPPTVARTSTTSTGTAPPTRSTRPSARSRRRFDRGRDHPPDRDVGLGPAGSVQAEGQRHRGHRQLVRSHRPRERVAPHPGDEVGPPDDEPGLRAADELVAAERHEVGAGRQPLGGERLVPEPVRRGVEERPGPQVVDDDRAMAVGQLGERARVGRVGEPRHREVGRVDAEDGPSPGGERVGEVLGRRPVRRADLDQPSPGAPDDVRDPDPAPDLDELAPGHDDPAATGQPDREGQGRGVVVRDERVLGPGQGDEVILGHPGPRSPAARPAIHLEEQVSGCRLGGGPGDDRRPRRPPEIRMDDDAGGVDDRGRRVVGRPGERVEALHDEGREVVGGPPSGAVLRESRPFPIHDLAGGREDRGRGPRTVEARPDRGQHAFDARRARSRCRHGSRASSGGSAWESNPPRHAERGVTGVEDRGTHRDPSAPVPDGSAACEREPSDRPAGPIIGR